MQIYIIGIGQCGTSVAFDTISELTGFVKSKEVETLPQKGRGVEAARNELQKRLNEDLGKTDRWKARIGPWLSRLWSDQKGRKAFILPKVAIIDGNPNNFVKDAFEEFSGRVGRSEPEGRDEDLEQLVDLIRGTNVLGLGQWKSGCANGLVGEAVTAVNLQPQDLRQALGVDDRGNLQGDDGSPFPVSVFLVVSSGGGATGSGGGVHLAQTDALLSRIDAQAQGVPPNPPSHTMVANAIVLPSIQASSNNRKYALNAGRALARHSNVIKQGAEGRSDKPSTIILFSNPPDEGNSPALQRLNNYLAEFAIRVANFTFPGNVANKARDVDERELTFLLGKTCVLAMSHLDKDDWYEGELESKLVERAFANIYEIDADKPHGLSVEQWPRTEEGSATSGLSRASSAMVMIGVPPKFRKPLCLAKINDLLREYSGSPLQSDIRTFTYGAAKNLELTVFLRYRTMGDCALAMHFVAQYVAAQWSSDAASMPEVEHILARAQQDDEYAETFEELANDIDSLGNTLNFGRFTLHRPAETHSSASPPIAGEKTKPDEASR